MGIIVGVFIVIVVSSVVYSAWTSSRAFQGVEFAVPMTAATVSQALHAMYSPRGAKGAVKELMRGVKVDPPEQGAGGSYTHRYATAVGDVGIVVIEQSADGAMVTAKAQQLFRGKAKRGNYRSGFYQLVDALSALTMKALFIRPNAPKIMRFQNRLEAKLNKQLVRGAS